MIARKEKNKSACVSEKTNCMMLFGNQLWVRRIVGELDWERLQVVDDLVKSRVIGHDTSFGKLPNPISGGVLVWW
jgi:hypothetical protein